MPPGDIAGFALEHAQNIRHTLGTSLVVGDQSIDVHSVVRTIQPTQQRLRKTSGIELAGVEEIASAPIKRRVHVWDKHLGEVAFVHDRAAPCAVVVGDC